MNMGYGKYIWSVRFPDVSAIPAGTQLGTADLTFNARTRGTASLLRNTTCSPKSATCSLAGAAPAPSPAP